MVVSERRRAPSTIAGSTSDIEGRTTYGMVRLTNPEAQDMQLVGVRVNASAGVEVLDVLAVPSDPPAGSWDGGPGLAPREHLGDHAAPVGATLPAQLFATSGELQILLVLRVPDAAPHAVNGIDVAYRVAGRLRESHFDFGLLFCKEGPDCAAALDRDPDAVLDDLGLLGEEP